MAQKVDRSDPRVRHVAYALYRDLLGTYRDPGMTLARRIPAGLCGVSDTVLVEIAPATKKALRGSNVTRLIDIIEQPAGSGGPGSVPPPPPPPPPTNGGAPPPPPPPPAMPGGVLQARRIPTELGSRAPVQRAPGEPPSVIQTAMATKDKKPFTYLPGGIDLSEIRSPRMQKRIMMNARSDGVQGQEAAAVPAGETPAAPPPPPPPPAPAAPPPPPPPPQRQAVPLASILTASTKQAQAQAPRQGVPTSPVTQPPPPPERAQVHRPQFRNEQGAQMAAPSVVKMSPPSPEQSAPPPQSGYQQQPIHFAPEAQRASPPKRASPPRQQIRFDPQSQPQRDASAPSTPADQTAANPPWRTTRKAAAPDTADSGATRGQGELYIRPVSVEAEPVQLRSAPLPWMNSSPATAEPAPEFSTAAQTPRVGQLSQPSPSPSQRPQAAPLQSQFSQEGAARPRMGFTQQMEPDQQFQPAPFQPQPQFQPQFQPQQPPQRQISQQGGPREHIISIQLEGSPPRSVSQPAQQKPQQPVRQAQQHPTPARQHSTSSQRVVPVQVVSGGDGSPHVNIGGRIIPLTAEGVTLPMGLVMAEPGDSASPPVRDEEPAQSKSFRLIQQIADGQSGATPAPPTGAAPRRGPVMTSTDPSEDLVPCMRTVQLSDGDRQLMSAFKDKVDDMGQYEAEIRPLYRGANIPSRLFRELDNTVSGGAPPAAPSRIGGPGQNRTVVVTMPTGGAGGPTVPASQQEAPEPRKYTGGNIPSRSFRVLQQMTAEDQVSAPVLQRAVDGQPRRSPSHYAHGPESVTAASATRTGTSGPHSYPPPSTCVTSSVPTCERIEQERLQQQRQQRERHSAVSERYCGGKIPSRAFQQLSGDFPAGEDAERKPGGRTDAVDGGLGRERNGQSMKATKPSAVPSRSFRFLQQEYGSEEPEQEHPEPEQEYQESMVIHVTPEQQKQKMSASSKTYRLLQADPATVPSVLGRNRR